MFLKLNLRPDRVDGSIQYSASSYRSRETSETMISSWLLVAMYSPRPIEIAPAMAPVIPARRMERASAPPPNIPNTMRNIDTRPSLTPRMMSRRYWGKWEMVTKKSERQGEGQVNARMRMSYRTIN